MLTFRREVLQVNGVEAGWQTLESAGLSGCIIGTSLMCIRDRAVFVGFPPFPLLKIIRRTKWKRKWVSSLKFTKSQMFVSGMELRLGAGCFKCNIPLSLSGTHLSSTSCRNCVVLAIGLACRALELLAVRCSELYCHVNAQFYYQIVPYYYYYYFYFYYFYYYYYYYYYYYHYSRCLLYLIFNMACAFSIYSSNLLQLL